MPACFIFGCKTGYKKNTKIILTDFGPTKKKDTVRLFCVPKNANQEIRDKWVKTLLALRSDTKYNPKNRNHRVCIDHFEKKFVIKDDTHIIKGELVKFRKDKWTLTDDAVPTIFDDAIQHRVKRSPKKRDLPRNRNVPANKPKIICYVKRSPKKRGLEQNTKVPAKKPKIITDLAGPPTGQLEESEPVLMNDLSEKNLRFHDISSFWNSISKQFPTWEQKLIKVEGNPICFFLEMDYEKPAFVKKQIQVNETLTTTVFIGDNLIQSKELATVNELKNLIQSCNSTHLCRGVGSKRFSDDCQKTSPNLICPPCKLLSVKAYHKQYKQQTPNVPKTKNYQLKHYGYRRKMKRWEAQRLKTRLELLSLRSEIKELNTTTVEKQLIEMNLDHGARLSIMESLRTAKAKNRKGSRYSTEWLLESTLLQIKSPAAYKHLRDCKLLPLPHPRTIKRLISGSPCEYGFNDFALNAIKNEMCGKERRDKQGVIVFDEIKLRKSLNFSKGTLKFDGYVNYGEFNEELQNESELADHALVFLYRPYNANWVQPFAVFATKNAASGDVLSKLLIECILRLENVGAEVVAAVSDGATTNKKLWSNLGISGKKDAVVNKIPHPCDENRYLHFCSDVPHIVKCIRNHFMEKQKLKYNGSDIDFKYYEDIFMLDEANETGLRKSPKLTRTHIQPNNFEKMRVNYATQLFSKAVAGTLEFYCSREKVVGSEHTQEFTTTINDLFDVLNSRLPREGLTLGSKGITLLENVFQILEGNAENTFASWQTLESLRVTIRTTVDITTYLISQLKFKYVLTAKLNQDCLEKFFGLIRAARGREEHPTVSNFIQIYRLLSIYTPMKRVVRGNVTSGESVNVLVNFGESLKKNMKDARRSRSDTRKAWEEELLKKISAVSIVNSQKSSSFVNNSLVYDITGYVVKKAPKLLSCPMCCSSLRSNPNETRPKEAIVTEIKDKCKGKMHFPSKNFYDLIVGHVEPVVEDSLKQGQLFGDILMKVIQKLDTLSTAFIGCGIESHSVQILCKLIPYYIELRFHFFSRSVNRSRYKLSK